jgi:hypothetical protein
VPDGSDPVVETGAQDNAQVEVGPDQGRSPDDASASRDAQRLLEQVPGGLELQAVVLLHGLLVEHLHAGQRCGTLLGGCRHGERQSHGESQPHPAQTHVHLSA